MFSFILILIFVFFPEQWRRDRGWCDDDDDGVGGGVGGDCHDGGDDKGSCSSGCSCSESSCLYAEATDVPCGPGAVTAATGRK